MPMNAIGGWVRSDEEREGYEAARYRKEICPYPKGSQEAEDWHKGHEDYFTDMADRRSSQREGW